MRVNFDYNLLLKIIDKKYNGTKIENKINEFCKDSKVKVYRFKKIIDNKACFESDEIYRMATILDLKKNEIGDYFFSVV